MLTLMVAGTVVIMAMFMIVLMETMYIGYNLHSKFTYFSSNYLFAIFQPGVRNFVWAYHKTVDTPYLDNINLKHTKSGLQKVELIKEVAKDPIHISYPPKDDRSSKASSVSVISALTFIMGSLLTVITVCAF